MTDCGVDFTLVAEPVELTFTCDGQVAMTFEVQQQLMTFGCIQGSFTGEANTAANVGGEAEIFRDKVGAVLNLRTISGINGITAVVNGDVVEIDGSGVSTPPGGTDRQVQFNDGLTAFGGADAYWTTDDLLALNGLTASFAGITSGLGQLIARLADDSDYAQFRCAGVYMDDGDQLHWRYFDFGFPGSYRKLGAIRFVDTGGKGGSQSEVFFDGLTTSAVPSPPSHFFGPRAYNFGDINGTDGYYNAVMATAPRDGVTPAYFVFYDRSGAPAEIETASHYCNGFIDYVDDYIGFINGSLIQETGAGELTITDGAAGADLVFGRALVGADANFTDFPDARAVFSLADSGYTNPSRIGLVGEATATLSALPGIGLLGIGTGVNDRGGIGVRGQAKVSNTNDAANAIALYGASTDAHVGGRNTALFLWAVNGATNRAIDILGGDINSALPLAWTVANNQALAFKIDATSGLAGIIAVDTTSGAERVTMAGALDVIGNATAATPTAPSHLATKQYVDDNIGSGHINWAQEEFTPTAAQITFIISSLPADAISVELYVNGVLYDEGAGADYVRSGQTITWLNPFVLKTTDQMIVRYQ